MTGIIISCPTDTSKLVIMDFSRPRDSIPRVSSSKLLTLTPSTFVHPELSPRSPLPSMCFGQKPFFQSAEKAEKIPHVKVQTMRANGDPLPIGHLPFHRGNLTSNSGIRSANSLDEGGILGSEGDFLMTQKSNTCKQPPTGHLLTRTFPKSSSKAALL